MGFDLPQMFNRVLDSAIGADRKKPNFAQIGAILAEAVDRLQGPGTAARVTATADDPFLRLGLLARELAAAAKTVATPSQPVSEAETMISDLNTKLTTQAAEIETLKAAVETERKRANDVIAGQGLDPSRLPSLSLANPTGANKRASMEEYKRILATDPKAAGRYFAENTEALFSR